MGTAFRWTNKSPKVWSLKLETVPNAADSAFFHNHPFINTITIASCASHQHY